MSRHAIIVAMRLRTDKSIIGHTKILSFLENSLKNGNVAHAYLFLGPEQVGKSTVAEWLVGQLMQTDLESHTDVSVLEREVNEKTDQLKSSISIEQVRRLRERLSMSPLRDGYKAALITDADYLSIEASNALLKTLEEPTKDTVIVLTAANESRLPATIQSRCQTIRFALVQADKIVEALKAKGIPQDQAEQMAAVSFGRPGAALNFATNPASFAEQAEEVKSFMRLADMPVAARLKYIADNLPKGAAGREHVMEKFDLWERVLRDWLLLSLDCKELTAFDSGQTKITTERSGKALQNLQASRQALMKNTNPQLTIENFLINL
jgi:DNA polymerase III subunit delta'